MGPRTLLAMCGTRASLVSTILAHCRAFVPELLLIGATNRARFVLYVQDSG